MLGAICQAVVINSQKVTATPRTQAFYATRRHGGVLTNLAVHDLDVLRWLGGDLTVTAAATQRHGLTEHPDFEDAGLVHCTLANGGVGVVACNWLAPDAGEPFQELTVIGTEGTAWISGGKLHALGANARSSLPNERSKAVDTWRPKMSPVAPFLQILRPKPTTTLSRPCSTRLFNLSAMPT